jgi:integrase
MKLTAKSIASITLPADKNEIVRFDGRLPGFGYRVRRRRKDTLATWIYQYGDRKLTIGLASAITPAKAFERASDLHARVRLGGDPLAEKQATKAERALHFKVVADQYLARQKKELRPSSYLEVERHLLKHAKPLHGMAIATLDKRNVAARLNDIANTSGAVAANRTRSTLSAMLSWAMKEGLAENNPIANTNKRAEQDRDRVLIDAELATIWNALDDGHFGSIVKLLMLTGQRRGEIAGLRWSEIDFQKGVISLPAERTKNGRAHLVPMSAAVSDILRGHPKVEGRDLIFGTGAGPFSGWSKAKLELDESIGERIGEGWVLHDLRRTCATRMADLGVLPHVVEAVLNHVSGHKGGIAGIYNRATYAVEKAQALALWATHITALVEGREGSNIVPLRA